MTHAAAPAKAASTAGMMKVLDVGALAYLPGDLSEMPAGSLRLLLLPEGKTVRQPSAGKFVCSAPFGYSLAPCIAVFSEESGLGERLVMLYTDYSLGPKGSMAGIGVMCHEFPLSKRGGKVKADDELIICTLEHVSEFKEVDKTDMAYKDVRATLEKSDIYRRIGITAGSVVQSHKFIKNPFLERMANLAAYAKGERAGPACTITVPNRSNRSNRSLQSRASRPKTNSRH